VEKCSLETNTKKSKWYKFKFRKISNLDYLREPSLVAQTIMNLPANVGDLGLVPGFGRSPGEGNGYSLQYSCLENPMDRGVWQVTVHEVAKSRTCD